MTDLNKLIKFSPSVWPGKEDLTPQPGDLTKFMANGSDLRDDFFEEKRILLQECPVLSAQAELSVLTAMYTEKTRKLS